MHLEAFGSFGDSQFHRVKNDRCFWNIFKKYPLRATGIHCDSFRDRRKLATLETIGKNEKKCRKKKDNCGKSAPVQRWCSRTTNRVGCKATGVVSVVFIKKIPLCVPSYTFNYYGRIYPRQPFCSMSNRVAGVRLFVQNRIISIHEIALSFDQPCSVLILCCYWKGISKQSWPSVSNKYLFKIIIRINWAWISPNTSIPRLLDLTFTKMFIIKEISTI